MKRIIYILLGLLPTLLTACVDENLANGNSAANNAIVLDFEYNPLAVREIGSRAKADATAENQVNDVLLVFFENKQDGNGQYLFTMKPSLTSNNFNATTQENGTALRARMTIGKQDFQNKVNRSGINDFVVYAFANTADETKDWSTGSGRNLEDELRQVGSTLTLNTFKTWSFYLKDRRQMNDIILTSGDGTDYEGVVERSTQGFLMMGSTTLRVDYNTTEANLGQINLQRLDAKIEFRVKGNNQLKIFPKRWRVHNVPVSACVDLTRNGDGPLYNPAPLVWRNFEETYNNNKGEPGEPANDIDGDEISVFTFYMPRNIQQAEKTISEAEWNSEYKISGFKPTSWQLYGMRTRLQERPTTIDQNPPLQIDTVTGTYYYGKTPWNATNFKYAPKNATWVEMLCNVYQDVQNGDGGVYNKLIGENVVYRVVLGGPISEDDPTPDNNNYTIEPNYHYIYNITVNSLSDIEAEVNVNYRDRERYGAYEDNSAVDGHLSQSSVAEMDSHYDAKAVLINYFDLKKKYSFDTNPNYDWTTHFEVSTPFDYVGRTESDYEAGYAAKVGKIDTTWVSFFIHPRTNKFGASMHPRFTLPFEYVRTEFPKNNSFWAKYYRSGPQDLMKYLEAAMKAINSVEKANGVGSQSARETMEYWGFDADTGDMIMTVYVNEFYYDEYPAWLATKKIAIPSSSANESGGRTYGFYPLDKTDKTYWQRNGWRSFVNKPNREMRITLGNKGKLVSSDGQSSVSYSDIYVYQHSIMAPYKLNELPEGYVGFGVELIEEDEWMGADRWKYSHVYNNNDYSPLQYNINIYDGRSLFQSMIYYGFLDNKRWWEMIDYNPNARGLVNTTNERGRLDQSQYRFYQTITANFRTGGDNWPAMAPILRNREANPDGDFRNATLSNAELKWYLPSLPQMEYIWMAQSAVPALYQLKKDVPYLTSTRLTNATNQSHTENVMFRANYGLTLRQRIVQATAGLLYPYAWDVGAKETRYYYGWNKAFTGGWAGYQENNSPLRVRAVRTLGVYRDDRIYRPAQRWLRGKGFTSDTQTGPRELAQIIIDCSIMPEEMLRTTPIRTGPLPEHTISSMWARPYKAFRVAKVSVEAAKVLNGWNHNENGYDNPIDGKWTYPKERLNDARVAEPNTYRVDPNASKPIRAMFDQYGDHPCRRYVEYGYNPQGGDEIGGWRLPNAMELMLMARLIPPQQLLDLTTNSWGTLWQTGSNGYAKGSDRNWSRNNNPNSLERVETLNTSWYNPAYLMSKTDTEDGKRFYGASFWAQLYGFRARPMNVKKLGTNFLIRETGGTIYDTRFDIRCVKDLTEDEVRSIVNRQEDRFQRDIWVYPVN